MPFPENLLLSQWLHKKNQIINDRDGYYSLYILWIPLILKQFSHICVNTMLDAIMFCFVHTHTYTEGGGRLIHLHNWLLTVEIQIFWFNSCYFSNNEAVKLPLQILTALIYITVWQPLVDYLILSMLYTEYSNARILIHYFLCVPIGLKYHLVLILLLPAWTITRARSTHWLMLQPVTHIIPPFLMVWHTKHCIWYIFESLTKPSTVSRTL